MGRRKKKTGPSNVNEGPTLAAVQPDESSSVTSDLQDWLEVKLLPLQAAENSRDFRRESIVFLTDQDAQWIDVINGDTVFLLARDTTVGADDDDAEKAVASAVCSVRIAVDGLTPMKASSSPVGKTMPRKQSVRLTPGNCRVYPASLSEFLSLTDGTNSVASLEAAVSPVRDASASPTTPKTSFSFARGGGGDKLISSSSTAKMANSPSTPSRCATQRLWVVPLHSPLGVRLLDMICGDATKMSFRLLTEVDNVTWSKSQRVLRRLVCANHADRLLHKHNVIGISFQGKGVKLKVDHVESSATDETIEVLSEQVASIGLDSERDAYIVEAVRRGLQDDASRGRLQLHKLVPATEIVFVNEEEEALNTEDMSPGSGDDHSSSRLVAGLDSTLEQVKSLLLKPLLRSDLFKSHSLSPPRGVLLHGPSGVGKSLLAQQIQRDLESDVHVKAISCTSLQSRTAIVGEAERHLSLIFESAHRIHDKPGTLLILDDIHLICPKRGSGNQGADRLSATLLALLDGIGASVGGPEQGNLMILGITSNPSLLDPALRRPGRLDTEVEVPIPDELSRAEIIRFQLERLGLRTSIPQLEDADYMALSRLAKGFNGADVMLAVKEAIRMAIGEGAESDTVSISMRHLVASIRSTKPSTISSITVEIPQVHWTSIGGMESVKQKLRESIELPITHAHLFEALNIPPPRGVLLYGPPGCSKTLMARALATEGQMNFLAVKGPELLSKWLGESERALASLFRRARMASPCIIFFDEIDAIASKRGGGEGSSGGERLLSQLLTELDGIGSSGRSTAVLDSGKHERVIVVGATNRPDLLDGALTRPGRIDRMIYVGLPDELSRARIFEIGLKGKACSDDVEVSVLSSDEMSRGFSGAELIAICREAALLAIEEADEREDTADSPQIAMRHLVRAIGEMQRQVTPEMLDYYASFNNRQHGTV